MLWILKHNKWYGQVLIVNRHADLTWWELYVVWYVLTWHDTMFSKFKNWLYGYIRVFPNECHWILQIHWSWLNPKIVSRHRVHSFGLIVWHHRSIVPISGFIPVESLWDQRSIVTTSGFIPMESVWPNISIVPTSGFFPIELLWHHRSIVTISGFIPVESLWHHRSTWWFIPE